MYVKDASGTYKQNGTVAVLTDTFNLAERKECQFNVVPLNEEETMIFTPDQD